MRLTFGDWAQIGIIIVTVSFAYLMTGCGSLMPVAAAPVPVVNTLCAQTHKLVFSLGAVTAMDRRDLMQLDQFNERWTKECLPR